MSVLQPYPEYVTTGIDFLDQIPSDWTIRPAVTLARVLTSTVDKHTIEGEVPVRLCNYTDVYYNDMICDGPAYMAATATPEQIASYAVEAGDVVFTKDSETADDIAIAAYVEATLPGVVYGYHLSTYRPRDLRYGKFLKWLLDSKYAKATFQTRTLGVTRVGLSQNTVRYFRVPTPPPDDAASIGGYLDRETAEIDAFIADQEELIGLLAERRAATISHAVTKGLDPSVPMTETQVDWPASVPSDWRKCAIRSVFTVLDCKHVTAEFDDDGEFPLASIREVKGDFVELTGAKRTSRQFFNALTEGGRAPQPDDLIISRNASVGEVALVPSGLEAFAMGQDVSLIRDQSGGGRTRFLAHVLRSQLGSDAFAAASIGSTFKRINVEDVKSMTFWMPETSDELDQICVHLERETAELDSAISDAEEAISLSRERRAALISAAVTGKIDVRDYGVVA